MLKIIAKTGKLFKGPTQSFAQFKPTENERIAELTVFLYINKEI